MLNSPLSKKVVRPLTKLIELLKVRFVCGGVAGT